MSWYVVKNEWGYWSSDLPPFDKFEDACKAASAHCHLNVVCDSLFREVEAIKPKPGNLSIFHMRDDENPETD